MGYDPRSLGPMWFSRNVKYEPQRTNNFQLEIYDLPANGTEELMLALQDFSLPDIGNPAIEIGHGSSKCKFAGQTTFGGMNTMQVQDYINTDIANIVNEWKKQVYNPADDTIGWAVRYKKDGTVTMFGPDGTYYRNWEVKSMWPESVNYGGSLSHEDASALKVEMTIVYDKVLRV